MRKLFGRLKNFLISLMAGLAAFVFTLAGYLMLRDFGAQIAGSVGLGLFALVIVWIVAERPNSGQARAFAALTDRLMAVRAGDLTSPAPPVVQSEMPELAAAVDGLFEQVRSNLDNAQAMAMYDPVTSLPNRVHFKREADRMLKAREQGKRLALLFIDLDGFKEVNDSLGHAMGDHVLMIVADRLREVVKSETRATARAQPLLARLAGDEFTLLFPAVLGEDEAKRIADRALAALNEPYISDGQKIDMGASIGVALCPRDGEDLTTLMKAADIAMYHAKASGRSQVCIYSPKLAAAFEEKAVTEREIHAGLRRGEFELAFQPQVSTRNGAIVAGEALVRWNHPEGGVRLPESFLRVAEDSNLVAEVGDWIVDSVAATLGRWQAAGLTQRLTFNVSSRQVERADFFKRLRAGMSVTGSPAWLLEIELSETMAMRCSESVLAELAALRKAGVSIALDDFGSGYSNLGRLKDMPLFFFFIVVVLILDLEG